MSPALPLMPAASTAMASVLIRRMGKRGNLPGTACPGSDSQATSVKPAMIGVVDQNAPRHQPISAKMPPISGPISAATPQMAEISARMRVRSSCG